ncbi:MAG TPA: hypothetical protein VJH03_26605 [Blastocatellia bacterium]|nr:hypothetical protein [Blastocatellia bacterium]
MKNSSKTANAVFRASSCLIAIASLMVFSVATWTAAAHVAGPAAQREEKGKTVDLTNDARVNGYTITEHNKVFLFRAINVRHPGTGKPLGGKHDVEIVCDKIPYIQRIFFNKGNSETRSKCLVLLVTPKIIIQEEE